MTVLVMMGVSGSGKTTIAMKLADRLGWQVLEGDKLHPPENIAKMKAGTPLDDDDRWPWLRAIAGAIDDWRAKGVSGVVACSALKAAYRDILIGPRTDVRLVYLQGSHELIATRMAARHGHFMPTGLLDSQFATLEEPGEAERPIVVSIAPAPDAIVDAIIERLRQRELIP
jgi:carbohydrate kinase (thermoresistant glucokinase family)